MYTEPVLPRSNRLTRKSDFDLVSKSGKVVQSTSFGFAFLEADDKVPPKIGFIVSNKISKKAVDRNKIRRVLREIVRENLGSVPNGFLFVILARRNILEKNKDELEKELVKVLNRIT